MSDPVPVELRAVVERFRTRGRVVELRRWGSGHIHETWLGTAREAGATRRYIFQRLNRRVFASPERVMDNVARITAHIRGGLVGAGVDPSRRVLTLVRTLEDEDFLRAADGECWRGFDFVEGARTVDVAPDARHAYEAARAFARYQKSLADLPPPPLVETIPGFADPAGRHAELLRSVAADRVGRVAGAAEAIDFARRREGLVARCAALLADGTIPRRIAHHDTKINNVMLDERTGEGICVIDLDTTMPGTALYDFGDLVRSAAGTAAEDASDPASVRFDLTRFDAIVRGWLEVAGDWLSAAEIDHLPLWARLVTFTIGVRFLTDHLDGDRYFRTEREHQNLDRSRTQFALVHSMEQAAHPMHDLVARHRGHSSF